MTRRLGREAQANLVPLARVEEGLAILGKRHTSYYGNYSPLEGQGRQVMTSKGREGRFGWSEGRGRSRRGCAGLTAGRGGAGSARC